MMLLSVYVTRGCICHDNVTLLFQCLDRHVVCKSHTDETPDGEDRPVQLNAGKNSLGVWTGSQKAGCAASASLPQDERGLSHTYEEQTTFDQQMILGQWLYTLITSPLKVYSLLQWGSGWNDRQQFRDTGAVLQHMRPPWAASGKKMRIQFNITWTNRHSYNSGTLKTSLWLERVMLFVNNLYHKL